MLGEVGDPGSPGSPGPPGEQGAVGQPGSQRVILSFVVLLYHKKLIRQERAEANSVHYKLLLPFSRH